MTTSENATPAAAPEFPRRERRRRGALTFLRDVLVIVLIALVVSFLVKTFLVRSFYIPSASMELTLIEQDRILVDELTPRFGEYERGDVVVFRDPGGWLGPEVSVPSRGPVVDAIEWVLSLVGLAAPDSDDHLIKRIIGLPGDHVVCCNDLGQVTVNGTPIDETSYIQVPEPGAPASTDAFDVTVPADSLWVMGDNRYRSKDSRYNQDQPGKGFVPVDNVVGRAFLITWPLDRFGTIDFRHEVFGAVPEEEGARP
ncbi:MAG: lepB 2 [Microbacterium sp.]|jgi:signal peptidase I|nr:lepB 2 [Microbacterium sp.]MDF2555016.1 lepB 2 [Microbacterium sp.]